MSEYREQLKNAAASASREWTLKAMSEGKDPTLDDFLLQFPLFDTKALREIAGKEMFEAKHMEGLNEGIG